MSAPTQTHTPAVLSRVGPSLKRAAFPWRDAALGSLGWALLVTISTALSLVWFRGYGMAGQIAAISAIYGAGAALAFAPAVYLARLITPRPGMIRIAALIVLIGLATILATAAVHALEYRLYFAEWHAPAFSRLWLWQQVFTAAGAVAQYAVIGLRFYLPFGVIGLVVMSLWANRMAH